MERCACCASETESLVLTFEDLGEKGNQLFLMKSRDTDTLLFFTAVIAFGWWTVDQKHHTLGGLTIVPPSPREIGFERRCKPRMSPNGHIVIRRLTALIFHNHLILGPLLKSLPPFSSLSLFVSPSLSFICTRPSASLVSPPSSSSLHSGSCDAVVQT